MDTEQNFSKWFRSEVAIAFTIGSVVVGIVSYFMNPVSSLRTDVAVLQAQVDNIKNNDLTHIYASQVASDAKLSDIQKQLSEQGISVAQILILEKRK